MLTAPTSSCDRTRSSALLGPSGSGKSTLLRVIAGLLPPDGGRVRWDGEDVTQLPTHRRRFGLVFQDHQLFPHRDVAANVGFGLAVAGRPEGRSSTLGWPSCWSWWA